MKQIVVINSKGGCGKSTLVISLADALQAAKIIDLDEQKTLTNASAFTGRHAPINPSEAGDNCNYLIYDTPPYNSSNNKDLLKVADNILIPVKESIPDLLATTAIIKQLSELHLLNKTCLVFNEVRRPHTNTYKECKVLFEQNFTNIMMAKSELSNLVAFRRVFSEPLKGVALDQILSLIKELDIYILLKTYGHERVLQYFTKN